MCIFLYPLLNIIVSEPHNNLKWSQATADQWQNIIDQEGSGA